MESRNEAAKVYSLGFFSRASSWCEILHFLYKSKNSKHFRIPSFFDLPLLASFRVLLKIIRAIISTGYKERSKIGSRNQKPGEGDIRYYDFHLQPFVSPRRVSRYGVRDVTLLALDFQL